MFTLKNKKRGFTLIELLVVIAIIGILSSVVLASLSTARQKSRDAKRISDLGQIQLALELYFDAKQSYPIQATAVSGLSTAAMIAAINTAPGNNFIPQIPATPAGANAYGFMGLGASSAECDTAGACATATSYDLFAQLERTDSTVLTTDADQLTTGLVLEGKSILCTAGGAAAGTAQPGGTEQCYDIKP